ncbi:LOW QUALITY PROTEIN: hypothetical protein U9M48_009742 [Paspalum notatum var. saurae]|uniref:Cytochrome P450 n=1 Tax=Paspalum notatum var. saurae TaxID=547442 RepID=A0AAQ3SS48_PASNO
MAMLFLFPWLAWLLVSVSGVYLLGLLTHERERRRGLPPGPRPLPVIGSLHLLGDQPHRSLARLAKVHGPLMSLRLGTVTTVVASSPAVAREFLQRHDAVFSNRSVPDATGAHSRTSSVWLPNAPRWRAMRKIMGAELFAPHRLDALQQLRREKVQELVDHVGRLARRGEPVDVGRVAFTTSLNLVSRTIFSRDLTRLDDDGGTREFQRVVTEIMEAVGCPNISDYFPAIAAADLQGWRRHLARLFARLHRIFDEEIDGRLRGRDAGEPRKNDFLDLLLDAADDGDSTARLDRDTLRSLFTDLFSAGSDTSSSTVEWAMTELLRSPTSMAKVCDELDAVIGAKKSIEESDIGRLPYLQAVVKETFRLHPPAPLLLPRHTQDDIKIMGYTIPKGSRVFVNVWAMGRDKETWSDPEKFMPERFFGKAVDLRGGDFDLIPFGGGRRICPGMPLAIRMVHMLLASMLNKFTWRLPAEAERNAMAMLFLFPWLAWLLVSVSGVYLLGLLTHERERRRGLPPGPRPLPVIGSLHLLGDQPHRFLARLAKVHGPLMSLRLGAVRVVASSPAVAREFLQRHDAVFSSRFVPDATGDDYAKNSLAWLPNGPRWRALRKVIVTQLFAPHRLDELEHLRREKVQELVDHVGRLAIMGEVVDIGRVAFATSLNLVSQTIFSRDLTSLSDDGGSKEFQEVATNMMEAMGGPNISDFFPALAAADLQGWRRRLARLFARLHRIFDDEIDGRLRGRDDGEPRKNDFLDLLLDAAEDGDKTARLDRETLRALFMYSWCDIFRHYDLFAAGSDTSSSTVEWAMAELLQSPTLMAKSCDEIARVLGSRKSIEESDIDQLPYLQAVVKETLRLHPPAPLLLPRHAQVDTKIMGYTIPKGSRVYITVWAMSRDKAIWLEPEKFMPERFMRRQIDFRGGDFDLVPFGAGRRICPGMPLAIRMVPLVLASILHKFTWRLPTEVKRNGVDMTEKFGLTLAKAVPIGS